MDLASNSTPTQDVHLAAIGMSLSHFVTRNVGLLHASQSPIAPFPLAVCKFQVCITDPTAAVFYLNTKGTKGHKGSPSGSIPSCDFVSFVVDEFETLLREPPCLTSPYPYRTLW